MEFLTRVCLQRSHLRGGFYGFWKTSVCGPKWNPRANHLKMIFIWRQWSGHLERRRSLQCPQVELLMWQMLEYLKVWGVFLQSFQNCARKRIFKSSRRYLPCIATLEDSSSQIKSRLPVDLTEVSQTGSVSKFCYYFPTLNKNVTQYSHFLLINK